MHSISDFKHKGRRLLELAKPQGQFSLTLHFTDKAQRDKVTAQGNPASSWQNGTNIHS